MDDWNSDSRVLMTKNPESSTWEPESTAWNPEFKTVLSWGEFLND